MLNSGRDLSSGFLRKVPGEKPHTLGSQRLGLRCGQKGGIASAVGHISKLEESCQNEYQKLRFD